jgi:phospholipid N-methyltransferase
VGLGRKIEFLQGYLKAPGTVGAVAPSSPRLAAALCRPYRKHRGPARVLEVGAGTGPVTRQLARLLKPGDHLDICEIDPGFVEILQRDVMTLPVLAGPVAEGRVRLLAGPVQEVAKPGEYDFVICGLPFTAFELATAESAMAAIRASLKPGGVLSYFEYIGLRWMSRTFTLGRGRRRIRSVSAFVGENIRRYQFDRNRVLSNFPPAYARHLRFDGPPNP